jgi:hypothetical protein
METKELVISREVRNRNPYQERNNFSFKAATAYSKVADQAKAEIDAFIERTHIDKMVGYEQPTIICAGKSQINKYGWAAKCPECDAVHCVSQVHPKNDVRLVRP